MKSITGGKWGKGSPRIKSKGFEKNCAAWNREAQQSRRRISVFPSLMDWLDEAAPIELLAWFMDVIYRCPNLNFLLLTKRPENFFGQILMAGMHMMGYRDGQSSDKPSVAPSASDETIEQVLGWSKGELHPSNVWIGVSVEDQKRADERIPLLLRIPAKARFISAEPLLSSLDLSCALRGESGSQARPCNIEWIRDGIRQCKVAGVAAFCKQLGSRPFNKSDSGLQGEWHLKDKKGGDMAEWAEDLRIRDFPV